MGQCTTGGRGSGGGTSRVNEVDEMLFRDQLKALYDFKILILGAGESGKSTIVKQISLIYKKKVVSDEDAKGLQSTLITNTYDCFQSIARASKNMNVTFQPKFATIIDAMCDENFQKNEMSPENAELLTEMLATEEFKQVYNNRSTFWLLDNADFYFDNMSRFASPDYFPTEEDFVMARVRTTGIITTEFDVKNNPAPDSNSNTSNSGGGSPNSMLEDFEKEVHFQVVDVGGQRNERRKWMNFFDNVKALIFCVNLAGYNLVLYEDEAKNRLMEDLDLFSETIRNPAFAGIPIFLLLNKKDLFEAMLPRYPLSRCFEDYSGDNSVQDTLAFIERKFRDRVQFGQELHVFHVAARVKMDVRHTFQDMIDTLIRSNREKIDVEKRIIKKEANRAAKIGQR